MFTTPHRWGAVTRERVRLATYAFARSIVGLDASAGETWIVTDDGALFAVHDLEAAPSPRAHAGRLFAGVARGPPRGFGLVDSEGDLVTMDRTGRVRAVSGVPVGMARDAVWVDERTVLVLLAGGQLVRADVQTGALTVVPTDAPVAELVVRSDVVEANLASTARAWDDRPPPVAVHHGAAPWTVDRSSVETALRHLEPATPEDGCHARPWGPSCTLTSCGHEALYARCRGGPFVRLATPSVTASGYVPFPDGQRIAGQDERGVWLGTREGSTLRITRLDLPALGPRELSGAAGDWLHAAAIREPDFAPQPDVVVNVVTRESREYGPYRDGEMLSLAPDCTLIEATRDADGPRVRLGLPGEPLEEVTLPPGARVAAMLDGHRGIAAGADLASLRYTCDRGLTWRAVEASVLGDPTHLTVDVPPQALASWCDAGRCTVLAAEASPLEVLFDPTPGDHPSRVVAPPEPVPQRARVDAQPRPWGTWYECRPGPGSRPEPSSRAAESFEQIGDQCRVRFRGRDSRGPYRARSVPVSCALRGYDVRASTRHGVLLGARGSRATWVTEQAAIELDPAGTLRLTEVLPDGRVVTASENTHHVFDVTVLGPAGVEGRRSLFFFYERAELLAATRGGRAELVVVRQAHGDDPRGYVFPLESNDPGARLAAPNNLPCTGAPRERRAWASWPGFELRGLRRDGAYTELAELEIDSEGWCLRRVVVGQRHLVVRGDDARLVGSGFVCAPGP